MLQLQNRLRFFFLSILMRCSTHPATLILSILSNPFRPRHAGIMAGPTRLELATSGVTGLRSNQLNYDPVHLTWAVEDLNLWPPACKTDALPAELTALTKHKDTIFLKKSQANFIVELINKKCHN